jgi:hypothetical protein
MSNEGLREAVSLIRSGNKSAGAKILTAIVKQNPNDELAWLWLSVCVRTERQKKYCLERVLTINPENENAKRILQQFSPVEAPTLEELSPTDTHPTLQRTERIQTPRSSQVYSKQQPKTKSFKKPKKKKRKPIYYIIAIIGALLSCCCLSYLGTTVSKDLNQAASPALDSEEDHPPPTEAIVEAVEQISTSTPVGELSAAEQEYLAEMFRISTNYAEELDLLSELSLSASDDPHLLVDEDWTLSVAVTLAMLDESANQLESIDYVPPKFQEVQKWLDLAAQETHIMVDNFSYGIDYLDIDSIEAAANNMNRINSYVENATIEMEKLVPTE